MCIHICVYTVYIWLLRGSCNTGDADSIPGLERSLGGGHRNLLQYSCLKNPTDRGAWWTTDHGVGKELDMTEVTKHAHTHIYNII